MVASPGRLQASFTAGELDEKLYDRTELKYFSTGAKRVENVNIHPQGGFSVRDGLRDVLGVPLDACRLVPFRNSQGAVYDLVIRAGQADIIDEWVIVASIALPFTAQQLKEINWTHRLDTVTFFHADVPTRLVKQTDTGWTVENLPFQELPNHDYGAVYTNAVPAEWQLEFVGLSAGNVFRLTVSGQNTAAIDADVNGAIIWPDVASRIEAAILALPNVQPGIAVTSPSAGKIDIVFSGSDNQGDGWAVSGTVINKSDAAIVAFKTETGVPPGEPIISETRGWPGCGMFEQQRFFVGGLKGLRNTWMTSGTGRYFNFDTRIDEADGAFVVPLDSEGGEVIEHLISARNVLVFTNEREYWISERAIDKTKPPVHVEASTHGTRRGVPVVKNEGAAIFVHKEGSVISEFRYTDVDGNFVSQPISILAPHLFKDVIDQALLNARSSDDANRLGVIDNQGRMRSGFLLREQDVTAFGRVTSNGGLFRAVSVNRDNQMSVITERRNGRRFERFEPGLLLDGARSFAHFEPQNEIIGLDHLNGESVWVIGDGDVYGPFDVEDGRVALATAVQFGEVGLWSPPLVESLPPPRDVGPQIIVRRQARIHTVWVSVVDTTSLAIAVNGQAPVDVPLRGYDGDLEKPELEDGYTGLVPIRGLKGYADEPTVTITQLRPGRLTVRSVTVSAKL